MRHCYFRIIVGGIAFVVFILSVKRSEPFTSILYLLVSIIFLFSAYSIWKKNQSKD